MTKKILSLFLGISSLFAQAQLSDFYEQKTVSNLHLYYSMHRIVDPYGGSAASGDSYKFSNSYPSLGFELEKNSAEKGGKHHYWRFRLANDIWATFFNLMGAPISSIELGGISSGFLGELGLGWNVIARDKMNFHLGLAMGDYILFTNNMEDGLQGWYFGLGPKAGYDMQLNPWLSLQVSSSAIYGYPSEKAFRKIPANGYPEYYEDARPFLFSLRTELNTKSDLYFAVDYLSPISGHSVSMSRLDFIFGFKY